MDREEILEKIPAEQVGLVEALLNGPKEVSDLFGKITVEEANSTTGVMPQWMAEDLMNLRPLSRKFIIKCLFEEGMPVMPSPQLRKLGFFGDWTPQR